MMLMSPEHLYVIVTQGKNTMILDSIWMIIVLFYVNSVKPGIFLLLTPSAYMSSPSIYPP